MTDNTQPDALQLADRLDLYATGDEHQRDTEAAAAELRRLHAYCQELEAQVIRDCMTHVQEPAEIEHVAGDVSKNGAGLDMTQQPVAQGVAIAAGAVYAELPDDVIDYVKGSYAFLQSTAPDGYAEEVFSLPPSATRNQRSLQDALQSDKHGWHPAAARQDSGDGKRSGPDAGVSASHGQAPAGATEPTEQQILEAAFAPAQPAAQQPHRSGCTAGTDEECVQRGCGTNCPAVSPRQGVAYAALPECLTCNDHGAVGNILTAEPCPDCTRLNAQPAPAQAESVQEDAAPGIDAAFEAVRRGLCKLPRYSFYIDTGGGVRKVGDRIGKWIEFDEAHALFDPISVDAARKQGGA